MIFVDYTFDLIGENLLLDPDLKPENIRVKHGDKFVVSINNGRIALIKVKSEPENG